MPAEAFEIPDELLDAHFGSDEEDTISPEEESPGPAVEDEEPEFDDSEEEEELEDEDTDESDAGDEEPVDEDELEEEDDSEDDEDLEDLEDDDEEEVDDEDEPEDTPEDEDDEESFLPKFDRKEIEKDPQLKAAYEHMRSKWTQAQQEARSAQREWESKTAEYEQFAEQLRDPAGAEEFLVAVAVNRPEVFEAAFQRATDLMNDDTQRKGWEREQSVKQRERELERRERADKQLALQQQAMEIESKTHSYAEELGLSLPSEVTLAEEAVAYVITTKRRSDPEAEITEADIQGAVKRVAGAIEAGKDRIRKQTERELATKQRKKVKKKAKAAKRRPPPKATSSPGLKSRKPPKPPKGTDPLDHWVDHKLGLVED